MTRPAGSKNRPKTEDPKTQKSGVAYVYNGGLVQWHDSATDANKIRMHMRNPKITELYGKMTNLLFTVGDPVIEVTDREEHNDENCGKKLRQMFSTPMCNLKTQARKCWGSWFYLAAYVANLAYSKELDADGWVWLEYLRHIPAESFDCYPLTPRVTPPIKVVTQSELLPGISLYSDEKCYYTQLNENGTPELLTNVFHVSPPNDMSGDPAGIPLVYPCITILEKHDFAMLAQMQFCSRVGAPSIFIKITNPIKQGDRDDIKYASEMLENWGNSSSYAIPDNFEIVPLKVDENGVAIETIKLLSTMLDDQFSPMRLISSEGSNKIGGSDEAAVTLLMNFVTGYLAAIADVFVPIMQDVLKYNGFEGYRVFLRFPTINVADAKICLMQAEFGAKYKLISKNEARALISHEPATDEDLKRFAEEWEESPLNGVISPIKKNIDGTELQDTNQNINPDKTVSDQNQEVSA